MKIYIVGKITGNPNCKEQFAAAEEKLKAEAVNSNTQLYIQAGNSIVKQLLMAIFKEMI